MTLIERIEALRNSKDDLVAGLTPAQIAVADQTYLAVTEHVTPLFIDNPESTDAGGINMDNLDAARSALTFYAELLGILLEHPEDEVNAVMLDD